MSKIKGNLKRNLITALCAIFAAFLLGFGVLFVGVQNKPQIDVCVIVQTSQTGQFENSCDGGQVFVRQQPLAQQQTTSVRLGSALQLNAHAYNGYLFAGYFEQDGLTLICKDPNASVPIFEQTTAVIARFAKSVNVVFSVQLNENTAPIKLAKECYIGQSVTAYDVMNEQFGENIAKYYRDIQNGTYIITQQNQQNIISLPTVAMVGNTPARPYSFSLLESSNSNLLGYEVYYPEGTQAEGISKGTDGNGFGQYYVPAYAYIKAILQDHYFVAKWEVRHSGTSAPIDYVKPNPWLLMEDGWSSWLNVTIKAIVEQGFYGLFYTDVNGDGEDVLYHKEVYRKNSQISMPTTPTKDGFVFAGWTNTKGGTSPQWQNGTATISADNTKWYAVWRRANTITYSYITASGERQVVEDSENQEELCAYSATKTILPVTLDAVLNEEFMVGDKTYSFVGYAESDEPFNDMYQPNNAFNLEGKPKYLCAVYATSMTITFDADGGTGASTNQKYTARISAGATAIENQQSSVTLTSPQPTLQDGVFNGWLINGETYALNGKVTLETDVVALAKWRIEAASSAVDLKGNGKSGNPYKISSARDFKLFLSKVNDGRFTGTSQYFRLENDITINLNEPHFWPVGFTNKYTGQLYAFKGVFDGNNHTITLQGDLENHDYVGVFGNNTGTIQNLRVAGNITGKQYVGGICGYNTGAIINCFNDATVNGQTYVGGICGYSAGANAKINKCYNTGNVGNHGTGNYFGGIVGALGENGVVINAVNNGAVNAGESGIVGGVAGNSFGKIMNVMNGGTLRGAQIVGGLVGQQEAEGSLINSYNEGRVISHADYAGGVTGKNLSSNYQNILYFADSAVDGSNVTHKAFGALGRTPTSDISEILPFNATGDAATIEVNGSAHALSWVLNAGLEFVARQETGTYCMWTNHQTTGQTTIYQNGWNNFFGDGATVDGWTGMGTMYDPYQIGCVADLSLLADKISFGLRYGTQFEDCYFVQTYDIVFDEETRASWKPIGGYDVARNISYIFAGTFDGGGYKIKNFGMNLTEPYVGLFGYSNGTIRNVTLENPQLSGGNYSGGIVGYNTGIIRNCKIIGANGATNVCEVKGTGSYIGGICGVNQGIVEECYSEVTTKGANTTFGLALGGIVGINLSSGIVRNCVHNGQVVTSTYQWVGGIVGQNHGKITNAMNSGTVRGAYYVGGLAGQNGEGFIENALSYGSVKSDNTYAGALAGGNTGEIKHCYYQQGSALDGANYSQFAIGAATLNRRTADQGLVRYFTDNEDLQDIIVNGERPSTLLKALNLGQSLCNIDEPGVYDIWKLDPLTDLPTIYLGGEWTGTELWLFKGAGVEGTPFQIFTEDDLYYLSLYVSAGTNFNGVYFKLENDIELLEPNWMPIGNEATPFAGIFDGAGHAVSGIRTSADMDYQALFGVQEGVLRNVRVTNSQINGQNYVAGICAHNLGKIEYSGFEDTLLSNKNYVGGICGFNQGIIQDCYTTGQIISNGSYVGGIVGVNEGSIVQCLNQANVYANNQTFGLAVGGIVGINLSSGQIRNAVSIAQVEGAHYQWVGGVVGQNHGLIQNVLAQGRVSGAYYIGGLIGQNGEGELLGAYTAATVDGRNTFVGAIAGASTGKIDLAFYLQNSATDARGTPHNAYGNARLGTTTADDTKQVFAFRQDQSMVDCSILSTRFTTLIDALNITNLYMDAQAKGQFCTWTKTGTDLPLLCNLNFLPANWNTTSTQNVIQGQGTEDAPYLIYNLQDLAEIKVLINAQTDFTNQHFRLMNDIDLNCSATNSWGPIGWYDPEQELSVPFTGIFDGNNHALYNAYFDSNNNYQGVFGYNAGTIKNLTVRGQIASSKNYSALLCGYNTGNIFNVEVVGNVSTAGSYVGGAVGVNAGNIKRTFLENSTISSTNPTFVLAFGGFVGINLSQGVIEDCYVNGTVSCANGQWVGGLVGQNHGTIINSMFNGNITGAYYVGGLVGQNGEGTIINSASYATVQGSGTFVGGVVGGLNGGVIENCYYKTSSARNGRNVVQNGIGCAGATASAQDDVKFVAPYSNTLTIATKFVYGQMTNNVVDALNIYVLQNRVNGTIHDAWAANNNSIRLTYFSGFYEALTPENFAGGTGTQERPYQISNARQLLYMANECANGNTYAGKYFVLTNDIYLNWRLIERVDIGLPDWQPIQNFAGTFNGQNFAVHGVFVKSEATSSIGLFAKVMGTIKNLCTLNGFVQGASKVGGLAGETAQNTEIENCFNSNIVVGKNSGVGGIVGESNGSILTSGNSGNVFGGDDNTGGVVGKAQGVVVGCFNKGDITGDGSNIGGVVGYALNDVVNSYNTGKIVGNGIAENTDTGSSAGGVVGNLYIQGVVNCYNLGDVSAFTNVGGIVGNVSANGKVKNNYSNGKVKGDAYVGGVVGKNNGTIDACYYILAGAYTTTAQFGVGAAANKVARDNITKTQFCDSEYSIPACQVCGSQVSNVTDALNAWLAENNLVGDFALYHWKKADYPMHDKFWEGNLSDGTFIGTGTRDNPYLITCASDLALLAKRVNDGETFEAKYFELTSDIYLNDETFTFMPDTGLVQVKDGKNEGYLGTGILGTGSTFSQTASRAGVWYTNQTGTIGGYIGTINAWTPIGKTINSQSGTVHEFQGTFDGAGHNISGLYLNADNNYHALFGYAGQKSTIQNLGVINSYICAERYAAGVAASSKGQIKNVFSEAIAIAKERNAGGIAAFASGASKFKNIYQTGAVCAPSKVGGLIGELQGSVENAYNWGVCHTNGGKAEAVGDWPQGTVATTNIFVWQENANATLNKSTAINRDSIGTARTDLNTYAQQNALATWQIDAQTGKPKFSFIQIWDGSTASGYAGGNGKIDNPYLISNGAELAYFAKNNKAKEYAKLIRNIYLNDETFMFLPDTGLVQVSDGVNVGYVGTGVKGDGSGSNTQFDSTASVSQMWYSDQNGTAGSYAGTLNSWNGSTLNATLLGNGYSIIGFYSTNSGLFQRVQKTTVQQLSVASGLVMGETVGAVTNYVFNGVVSDCHNGAVVVGTNAGGVVGETECTFTLGPTPEPGGGVHEFNNTGRNTIEKCSNSGVICGNQAGGVVYLAYAMNKVENCNNYGAIYGAAGAGGVVQKLLEPGEFWGAHYGTVIQLSNLSNGAEVTATDGYAGGIVGNLDSEIRKTTNYKKSREYFEDGTPWIYYWEAEYDLNPSAASMTNCINYGTITGTNYVGGIVGDGTTRQAILLNIENHGQVSGKQHVGGVFGRINSATVTNIKNTAKVTGTSTYVAGLMGRASGGTYTNLENTGEVYAKSKNYVAGLIGSGSMKLTGGKNFGKITGSSYVGGIIGSMGSGGLLENVFNFANLNSIASNCGGIVGNGDTITMKYCYNSGSVMASSQSVGGIAGKLTNCTLTTCYAACDVGGTYYIGGFVGNNTGGTFADCQYAYGLANATKSKSKAQYGVGVAENTLPVENTTGISKFDGSVVFVLAGDVKILDKEAFLNDDATNLKTHGANMFQVQLQGQKYYLNNKQFSPHQCGMAVKSDQAILLAYRASAAVYLFVNGVGKLQRDDASGWNVDNEGLSASKIIKHGGAMGTLPVPIDEKYTFAGWYVDMNCTTRLISSGTTYDSTFSQLYAKWTITEYQLSISVDGIAGCTIPETEEWLVSSEQKRATKKVRYGAIVGTLPTLTKEGYVFDGWFSDSACKNRVTKNTLYDKREDGELFAKFTPLVMTIIINLNGVAWENSGIDIQIYKKGNASIDRQYSDVSTSRIEINTGLIADTEYIIKATSKIGNEEFLEATTCRVDGRVNCVINYYSLILSKGDQGINCVYIDDKNNGQVEDIHNNTQIYLAGQDITINAVVAETDNYEWDGWHTTDGENFSSQKYTIKKLEKGYTLIATAKPKTT